MARWIRWVTACLLIGGLLGCDRGNGGAPADDGAQARCRGGCRDTYRSCSEGCKNDAPQACESRCDDKNRRCYEACDAKR
jgi:hypothetical protein